MPPDKTVSSVSLLRQWTPWSPLGKQYLEPSLVFLLQMQVLRQLGGTVPKVTCRDISQDNVVHDVEPWCSCSLRQSQCRSIFQDSRQPQSNPEHTVIYQGSQPAKKFLLIRTMSKFSSPPPKKINVNIPCSMSVPSAARVNFQARGKMLPLNIRIFFVYALTVGFCSPFLVQPCG